MPKPVNSATIRFDLSGQVIVALGYMLMAWLGFVLVRPPFYNSVVWVADGFALGLMLAWGPRIWPGVLVGALLANGIVVSPALGGDVALWPMLAAAGIAGLGVMSQVVLSYWLLSPRQGRGLDYSGWELARFLIIAGPLAVAWGTSIGLGAYTLIGPFETVNFWARWANWYSASVIGVITVAPIVYLWASPQHDSSPRRTWGMTVSIGSVLLVTTTVLYILRSHEHERIGVNLRAEARAMAMTLEQYVVAQADLLEMARLHFEAGGDITRAGFERFGSGVLGNNSTVVNMLWLPQVMAGQRQATERRLSEEYAAPVVFRHADSTLTPMVDNRQPVYYPVAYALGSGRFADFVGADWGYAPSLGPVVSRSILTRSPALTPPFRLPGKADGAIETFLVQVVPVRVHGCQEQRPGLEDPCVRGLIALVTTAEQLARRVWPAPFLAHFDVTLTDQDSAQPILHSTLDEAVLAHFRVVQTLRALDRTWRFEALPSASYTVGFRSGDTWLLIGLLSLFSLTIVWVLLYASSAHSRVEHEVQLKTAQLAAAVVEAQRANRAKSEFLANMSHELRTPLNSILGFTRRVVGRESNLSQRAREALETVDRNGQHLLNLINDLLDVSRIEAGKLRVLREPIALKMLVEDAVAQIEPQLTQRGLQLHSEIPDDLPQVLGDRTRILQILLNLLSNAIKFTEHGTVTIKAEVAPRGARAGIAISVQDTGQGIAQEDLSRLFRRYTQLDNGTRPGLEGSGLGLVLVRELAALHGGDVSVQSELGHGSGFTVWLPAIA